MKKILVIGSLNMDLVVSVENMPLLGETILGKNLMTTPGGKGANQACALGRLGASAVMLGCVGSDAFGDVLLASLTSSGIDTSRIQRVRGEASGTAVIYVSSIGANSIVVIPGANSVCDVDYLKDNDDAFCECDMILLQMEIPHESIYYAVKRGAQLGKTIILNPAPAPESIPDEVLSKLNYITPNETELARLTGLPCTSHEELSIAARTLAAKIGGQVLVTIGKRGALLASTGEASVFPTIDMPVVDTTAAGDCFNAAFVQALAEGKDTTKSIEFANVAAALSVSKKGAQDSLPDRVDVNKVVNSRHSC